MDTRTKRKWLATVVTFAVIGIVDALFLEKYFFGVKTFHIGKKNGRRKIKLLLLTDLHFKRYLDPSYKKLAKKVNEINPDLVLIAGDVVDEDGMYAPAKKFFSWLNHSIPKVAIMGNHDHKNRVRLHTYRRLYEQNNCDLLINQSKDYKIDGRSLTVTGVDDFINGSPSFALAVKNIGKEENHLLLIHSPLQQETILKELRQINELRPEKNRLNIQYIFAGHNHGGQVTIFGYPPKLPDFAGNYLSGWYNSQPPYLYLSKGFGTSTLPFRFGARAEVTVFYLGVNE